LNYSCIREAAIVLNQDFQDLGNYNFETYRKKDDAFIASKRKMSLILLHNNHRNHNNHSSDKNTIKGFKRRLPTYHLK